VRGDAAEQLACEYLVARGLRVLARNFRCAGGELDLVLADAGELVVVEVRCRADGAAVDGLASLGPAKCRRIIHATEFFLLAHPPLAEAPVRFDVVTVTGAPPAADIGWFRAAFTADDVAGPRGFRV
jgi:putative endonuclease